MRKLLIRGGLSLLGTAVMLAWWSYGPHGKSGAAPVNYIPAKVGAGGQMLQVDAESTCAATMRVSFEQLDKPPGEQIILNSSEKVPAGTKSWSIDVPSGVGGYIELEADHPNAGDTLTMRVHMNGKLVDEQTDKLDGPLEPNTAFFVQDHYDDYSKAAEQAEAEEPGEAQ
jgi:hypothetical protein